MYLICRKNNPPHIVETVKSEKEFGYYYVCGITVVDLKTNKYLAGIKEDPIHGTVSTWEQVEQKSE